MITRVIPKLDIKGPNLVKGVHLEGLRVLGKPWWFAKHYYEQGADELIYMDAVASLYDRNSLLHFVEQTSKEIFIPITVGGGLRTSTTSERPCGPGRTRCPSTPQPPRIPSSSRRRPTASAPPPSSSASRPSATTGQLRGLHRERPGAHGSGRFSVGPGGGGTGRGRDLPDQHQPGGHGQGLRPWSSSAGWPRLCPFRSSPWAGPGAGTTCSRPRSRAGPTP